MIRHHVTPMTSLPMALAQELELARKKEEEEQQLMQGNGVLLPQDLILFSPKFTGSTRLLGYGARFGDYSVVYCDSLPSLSGQR